MKGSIMFVALVCDGTIIIVHETETTEKVSIIM